MYAEGGMYQPDAGDVPQPYSGVASAAAATDPAVPEHDEQKPRLLLMGLRRSGKSSIQEVVFHKLSANDTLFLESTNKLQKDTVLSFLEFGVWDFPGPVDYHDPEYVPSRIFAQSGALIYVIDAQDDYVDALANLHSTITQAHRVNPNLLFEVFIHKVDGLSDDYKIDTQRDIQMRMADELAEMGLNDVHVSYHLTSIYDNTIFEAFSKVIQKLIPQLPTLENLLNILCSNSGIEKAFLFDVASKIYVATDSSPVDVQSYEICSDMIDVVLDISNIYGYPYLSMSDGTQGLAQHAPGTSVANPSSATPPQSAPGGVPDSDNTIDAVTDASDAGALRDGGGDGVRKKDAYSIIKLNNGMVLYLRQMNRYLALVSLIRSENFEKLGLIEYNFRCFNEALNGIFRLRLPQAATQEENVI